MLVLQKNLRQFVNFPRLIICILIYKNRKISFFLDLLYILLQHIFSKKESAIEI